MWPRPRKASLGVGTAMLLAEMPLFHHHRGCCQDLIESAFARATARIFWAVADGAEAPPLPHLRAKAPGVREHGTPPERRHCAAGTPLANFTRLVVEVESAEPTDLQLGVDESYSLELAAAGGGGVLRAATEWGALHGLETFSSLAQWDGAHTVLCQLPLQVKDAPEYPWRGLLVDTARHFLPVADALLPLLDGMAALKLNVLHWHLCDAHSFPFGSAALPELPARGAFHPSLVYSAPEMRAVVAAARERGIRVVPELDMPAHAASWALGVPDLVVTCPARTAADAEGLEHGVNKAALHPLREGTYEAVGRLLAEMADVFPDAHLHLGGDEVDGDCWLTDPAIAAWAEEYEGGRPRAEWKHELQALFTSRVVDIARTLRRRVLLWDEALEFAPLLPREHLGAASGVVIDVWRDWLRTNYELRDRALLAGHAVVWSSLSWYLDLHQNTWDTMYQAELPAAKRAPSSLLGGETSSWSEHADAANLQQRVLTRAAAVAERLWSGKPSQLDTARQRLAALRCRLVQQRGLSPSPVLPDHCEGRPLTANARGLQMRSTTAGEDDEAYRAELLAIQAAAPARGPRVESRAIGSALDEPAAAGRAACVSFAAVAGVALLMVLSFCAGLRRGTRAVESRAPRDAPAAQQESSVAAKQTKRE